MDAEKRERLEDAGFRVGSVAEFLGLSAEQSELIEIKLALTAALKKQRKISSLSQHQLADKIGSSQSRVAKMEVGNPHVSLDLMIRALFALGMTRNDLANVICPDPYITARRKIEELWASAPQNVDYAAGEQIILEESEAVRHG